MIMDTKAFEEKVLQLLEDFIDIYSEQLLRSKPIKLNLCERITSLIEPLIELVKAYEELDEIYYDHKDLRMPNVYWERKNELRQKISELRKQIEK